ncbi:MAG: tyrosine-type recombinase/integrase [Pseudomonadota bacterium]
MIPPAKPRNLRGQRNGREICVKIEFKGLIKETLKSGHVRYRVRREGNKNAILTLPVGPEDKRFQKHYEAARRGIALPLETVETQIKGSLGWLIDLHLAAMRKDVAAENKSTKTLRKRTYLLNELKATWGGYDAQMPPAMVYQIRDGMSDRSAWADAMVEALRVMFRWAEQRGYVTSNPALGVEKIHKSKGGATPWTLGDLETFREAHRPGSMPFLALTLLAFTACRIDDARLLGRSNESVKDGTRVIGWQPGKSGSAFVEIPMAPQLYQATRAMTVEGKTYLLTRSGAPFASGDVMSATFKRWCIEAGLPDRSAHGVRKAVGELLAEGGCSQYHVMTIHGHTQARTSESYTQKVRRARLAADAMQVIAGIEW